MSNVLGTIVSDLVKAGKKVESFIVKVAEGAPAFVAKVAADEAKIVPVLEAFVPGSAKAITVGNNLFDKVAQAVEDAGPAAGASGLSVSLDQALVNDVKAVIAAAKAFAGNPVPAPTVTLPQPVAPAK